MQASERTRRRQEAEQDRKAKQVLGCACVEPSLRVAKEPREDSFVPVRRGDFHGNRAAVMHALCNVWMFRSALLCSMAVLRRVSRIHPAARREPSRGLLVPRRRAPVPFAMRTGLQVVGLVPLSGAFYTRRSSTVIALHAASSSAHVPTRLASGSDATSVLPYDLLVMRRSKMATMPRSVSRRRSRPKPC